MVDQNNRSTYHEYRLLVKMNVFLGLNGFFLINGKDKPKHQKISICLSYFDLARGPRELIVVPTNTQNSRLFVSQFFDFHDTGDFFTHLFNAQLSFNYLFDIEQEDARGGSRMFMLTALVSLGLFKKKNLLQYYPSIENLFKGWANSFSNIENVNDYIVDGAKAIQENSILPLKVKIEEFVDELHYIIESIPEVVPVPINTFNNSAN